jgi:ATP-dependent DNA helicase RecG
VFQNPGTFYPGDILPVLQPWFTSPYYRNQLLADAMTNFNMIDTVAMGIRRVFRIQQGRYFPMPDYDLSFKGKVAVRVYGKTLDENYTRLLFEHQEYDLETVFLIDRVQKKLPLNKEQTKYLRSLGVIEGKSPHIFVSAMIAESIDEKAQYIKNRGQSNQHYRQMIVDYLKKWSKGTKADFLELLGDKLPDVLNEKQKVNKVKYLLTSMHEEGIIEMTPGNPRTSHWVLVKTDW